MNDKKFFWVATVLIILGLVLFVFYFQKNSNSNLNGDATLGESWTKTGYLIKNNPGFKPGVWYLSYESAGTAAQSQELILVNTECKNSIGNFDCSQLKPGDRVEVFGTQDSGQPVQVSNIIIFSNIPAQQPQTREIKLFYYNETKDKQLNGGQIGCSQEAILPVSRTIPLTNTPIQDSINELVKGLVTAAEKSQGFKTEFPNIGFKLLGANLSSGTLTLEFTEVPGFTGGGSCRVSILAGQITKTARQFSEVKNVQFKPVSLFQP